MAWHRVCGLDEIREGSNKAFEIGNQPLLVARTALGLFAVGAICSHQQQNLEGGKMKACFIFCPLHGVRFDLRDGRPAGTLTDRPIPTFPAKVENGDILVELGT